MKVFEECRFAVRDRLTVTVTAAGAYNGKFMSSMDDQHVNIGVLFESARLKTGLDVESQSHVEVCGVCRSRLQWMEAARKMASHVNEEPPEAILNKVLRLPHSSGGLRRLRHFILGSLTFDSLRDLAPAGVRRSESGSRELRYEADDLEIAFSVRRTSNGKLLLTGQVLRKSTPLVDPSASVHLVVDGDHIATSDLSPWGEFLFSDVPDEPYGLQLHLPDRVIAIPQCSPAV